MWIVLAWLVPLLVLLVFEKNMWRPHIAAVALPLALLVALRPPPLKWFAIALIALVPWWAVHLGDILWPAPYHGAEAAVVAEMRALPKGAWVITDEPGLAWRAGRRMPAALVDGSVLRILEHLVTTPIVARAAADPRVCAVVVWSTRYGRDLPGLPGALRADGYTIAHRYGGVRTFWLKQTHPLPHAGNVDVTSAAAAELVEPTKDRDAVDHASERHPLRRDVQHEQHAGDHRARGRPGLEHRGQAECATERVGAGVAQHHPFAEIVGQQRDERAHDRGERDTDRVTRGHDRQRDPRDDADLERATG